MSMAMVLRRGTLVDILTQLCTSGNSAAILILGVILLVRPILDLIKHISDRPAPAAPKCGFTQADHDLLVQIYTKLNGGSRGN